MEMKVKASHRGNEPLEITDAECEREAKDQSRDSSLIYEGSPANDLSIDVIAGGQCENNAFPWLPVKYGAILPCIPGEPQAQASEINSLGSYEKILEINWVDFNDT